MGADDHDELMTGVAEGPSPEFDGPASYLLRLDRGPPFEPHRFTVEEILALQEAEVIHPDSRFELLDGEIIAMPEEGELHLTFKIDLSRYLFAVVLPPFRIVVDGTLHIADLDALEPDFYVLDGVSSLKPVDPGRLALVVEIAVTSLNYDLGRKLAKYAAVGIPEYWVIDTGASRTVVFRRPHDGAYRDRTEVAFQQVLTTERLPQIALRIADLPHIG